MTFDPLLEISKRPTVRCLSQATKPGEFPGLFIGLNPMSVSALISKFSTLTEVPVDLDLVVTEIRALGVTDEIFYFNDPDLDSKTLSGHIVREEIPWENGKSKFHTTITYAKLGDELERIVCCKELIHILDPDHCKTNTKDSIESLINKIVLPPSLVDAFHKKIDERIDRVAIIESLSILFPYAAREIMRRLVAAGRWTMGQVAERVELPLAYTAMVMSDEWNDLHDVLVMHRTEVENGKD